MRRSIVAVIALLAVVPMGAAATPDVTVETLSGQTCPTSSGEYRVTVHNPGPATDHYDLVTHGPWQGAAVLDDSRLKVGPDGTATAYLWVRAPENAAPGSHGFTVDATSSNTGGTASAQGTLKVLSCRSVDVSIAEQPDEVCRGDATTATATVTNTGQVTETFRLSTSHGELDVDTVTLEPGESRTVTATVHQDTALDAEMAIEAASTTSYASDTAGTPITVASCRSVDVAVDAPDAACLSDGNASVAATVRNTGSIADTYDVSWRDVTRTVTVGAGEETTLDLALPVEEGENTGTVTVASTSLSTVERAADVSVTGETCYAVDVAASRGRVRTGGNNQTLMTVTIANPGTKENAYDLALDGPGWMSVRPTEMTVAPGDQRTATIYIAPDFFGDGEYTAKLVVTGEAVRAVSDVNVTASNGTIVARSEAAAVTGAAVTQQAGIVAMGITAFLLFIGGYWYFRRIGVEPETDE